MDPKKIAERNREILSFLKAANSKGGRFPSPDELQTAIGRIGRSGRRRAGSKSATVSSKPESSRMTNLSIAGAIPAGFGDPTEPAELSSIPVDLQALNIKANSQTFALRVRGDSMVGAFITDGDLVIVEAREPKIGDVVAALIDGETTLKRFVTDRGQLFLRAENPNYPDLIPLRELTVQGVVCAIVRVC